MALLIGAFVIGIIIGIGQIIKGAIDNRRAEKEAEAEYDRWINRHNGYDGIHLSEEQIRGLEAGTQLPCLPATSVPIVLSAGETAVYHTDAEIVKNDYFFGELVITTKRVVFIGDEKGFDLQNIKISSFLYTGNGITIQSGRSIYKLELDAPHLVKAAFDGVISKNIPVSSQIMNDRPHARGRAQRDTVSCVTALDNVASIDHMEGHEFEHFCAELLRKNGYTNIEVTRGSGDQGVDVLASKEGIRYAIQCKNYATHLSNTPVQEVKAGCEFYKCHVGVVMTNSTFTPGAVALAEATKVLLWDRAKLQELIDNVGGLEAFGMTPNNMVDRETKNIAETDANNAVDEEIVNDYIDTEEGADIQPHIKQESVSNTPIHKCKRKYRKVMRAFAIFFFVMTGFGVIASLGTMGDGWGICHAR